MSKGVHWTQVQNGLPFMVGKQNSGRRGDATYSLHKEGRRGWIVKQYRGKIFVFGPVVYTDARDRYNRLLTGDIAD